MKCICVTLESARWGVVEWMERPLLMLEVWGSNPGHSTSKKYHFLTPKPKGSPRSRAHLQISELSVSQAEKKRVAKAFGRNKENKFPPRCTITQNISQTFKYLASLFYHLPPHCISGQDLLAK